MVADSFIDLEETGHLWMQAWRCMNCGCVADAVVEENRRLQLAGSDQLKRVAQSDGGSAVSGKSVQQAA
jgi:hypothetical protein